MVYCSTRNIDSIVKCPVQFNGEGYRTGNWYESNPRAHSDRLKESCENIKGHLNNINYERHS